MDKNQAREINQRYAEILIKHYGDKSGAYDGKPLLFHANTVRTAISFLEQGELISRQEMEKRGLDQTPQKSDALDKMLGIYNDIFFDSVDVCHRGSTRNYYGPVLFCFHLDLLEDLDVPIKITKTNPDSSGAEGKWTKNTAEEERYYASPEEYEEKFAKGAFGCHLTIPNCASIPLKRLAFIRVDVPERLENTGADYVEHIKSLTNKKVTVRTPKLKDKFEESYYKMNLDDLERNFCCKGQKIEEKLSFVMQKSSAPNGAQRSNAWGDLPF